MEPIGFMPASANLSWELCLPVCIEPLKENLMSQSTHDRAAELHNLAAHAHAAAAAAHGKADHLTAHELSKKALEFSSSAHKHSEQLLEQAGKAEAGKAGKP